MKLQLMSDLHTCFYTRPLAMLESLEFAPDLDFLLLPGDLVVPCRQGTGTVRRVFDFLSSKARHCLFACGNHEYYHGDKETAEALLEAAMPPNFHWLRNEGKTIDGQHFFGGTLWFPSSPLNPMYEDQLSDFLVIRRFKDWVYEENQRFTDAAELVIIKDTIVLSHHLPSYQVVHPASQGDNLNRFFVSDQTKLIERVQPKLWVYGHTHFSGDIMVGNTRVITNSLGYPSEIKEKGPYFPVTFEF